MQGAKETCQVWQTRQVWLLLSSVLFCLIALWHRRQLERNGVADMLVGRESFQSSRLVAGVLRIFKRSRVFAPSCRVGEIESAHSLNIGLGFFRFVPWRGVASNDQQLCSKNTLAIFIEDIYFDIVIATAAGRARPVFKCDFRYVPKLLSTRCVSRDYSCILQAS